MIAKCKDITNKINVLENRVSHFSKPKLSFSGEPKRRPSTAPNDSTRVNSRVKLAENMISQMQMKINKDIVEDYSKDLSTVPKGLKCDAEREFDAVETPVERNKSCISFKNSPITSEKCHCGSKRKNLVAGNLTNMGDVTVMDMMNNFSGKWPIMNSSECEPSKLTSPAMDNFLIDSLRGEIEKVRHRLCAIGNRSCQNLQTDPFKENTIMTENPSGDQDYQFKLLKVIRDLEARNEELNEQLKNYRTMQENSLKKTEETANLLKTYENKVKTLHEQTLKSSRIMADSKEKFCSILRSRNEQIKNLFNINQQLKKNMFINEEKMNKLNNSYKLLKENYKELENSDKRNKAENDKFRENMAKLEKELKFVYKECSTLKEENVRFLKELNGTKEDVIRKYASKLDEHENQCKNFLLKTVESEAKLLSEVAQISDSIQTHGNELENIRSEVKFETMELESKYKKLVNQYEALVRKFREYEQFDEIKCSCIEQELKEFSMKMKEKEGIILKERDELRALVEELAKAIKRNRAAIRELNLTNEEQENVIENLNEIIRIKDKQVLEYQEELKQARMRDENSQYEIDNLKRVLNEIEQRSSPGQESFEQELQNSRETLKQEKETNLIKQKIIQDHERTISDLKKQLNDKSNEIASNVVTLCKLRNEVDRLSEDLTYKELGLEKEKKEKIKILAELESIKTHKEALIAQISELENAIKYRCRDDEISQIDQKKTIDKLQKQMRQRKDEWEVQRKNLQKDKEKALHAAKFASRKLLDTVSDFQKQMCQQKAAQTKLAILLQGKEQQLQSLTMKVRSLLPSQKESGNCSSSSRSQNICPSFCQIKQLYPGPEQMCHSKAAVEEHTSRVLLGESNSCCACCD